MKKIIVALMVAGLLAGLAFVIALAFNGNPVEDTFVRSTEPTKNFEADESNLLFVSAGPGCSQDELIFLKWDLSTLPPGWTIGTATLDLNVYFATGNGPAGLTLYRVANDTWLDSTITYTNSLSYLGTPIQTVSVPAYPFTGTITYGGVSNNLRDYLQAESNGDNYASVAIRMDVCDPLDANFGSTVFIDEVEAPAVPGDPWFPPLITLLSPTKIGLLSIAARPANSEFLLQPLTLAAGLMFATLLSVALRRRLLA